MKSYIGTKLVKLEPMTRGEYNLYQGWAIPKSENPDDEGYLVEYIAGNKGTHPNHDFYIISWTPKDVADNSYRPTDDMSFGIAIEAAKMGKKIARAGWNGKNMFVVYMPPLHLPPFNTQEPGPKVNDRTAKYIGEDTPLNCQPYFAMFNAQKQWIPGWVSSQSDMLADDWQIVE